MEWPRGLMGNKSSDENKKQNSNDNCKAFWVTQKGNKNVALDIKNVDIKRWFA